MSSVIEASNNFYSKIGYEYDCNKRSSSYSERGLKSFILPSSYFNFKNTLWIMLYKSNLRNHDTVTVLKERVTKHTKICNYIVIIDNVMNKDTHVILLHGESCDNKIINNPLSYCESEYYVASIKFESKLHNNKSKYDILTKLKLFCEINNVTVPSLEDIREDNISHISFSNMAIVFLQTIAFYIAILFFGHSSNSAYSKSGNLNKIIGEALKHSKRWVKLDDNIYKMIHEDESHYIIVLNNNNVNSDSLDGIVTTFSCINKINVDEFESSLCHYDGNKSHSFLRRQLEVKGCSKTMCDSTFDLFCEFMMFCDYSM